MIWVSKAKYEGDYRVPVEFNDGGAGIVDLGETILNDPREIFVNDLGIAVAKVAEEGVYKC